MPIFPKNFVYSHGSKSTGGRCTVISISSFNQSYFCRAVHSVHLLQQERKRDTISQSDSQTRIQYVRTLVPQSIDVKPKFVQKHTLWSPVILRPLHPPFCYMGATAKTQAFEVPRSGYSRLLNHFWCQGASSSEE